MTAKERQSGCEGSRAPHWPLLMAQGPRACNVRPSKAGAHGYSDPLAGTGRADNQPGTLGMDFRCEGLLGASSAAPTTQFTDGGLRRRENRAWQYRLHRLLRD